MALYKDSVLISALQFISQCTNHAYNISSVTPGPNEFYFLENPGTHSNGGSGSGSADGVFF